MRLYLLPLMLILLTCGLTACASSQKNAASESKVDSVLTQGALSSNPPEAGPAEPQKSFDQEAGQSR